MVQEEGKAVAERDPKDKIGTDQEMRRDQQGANDDDYESDDDDYEPRPEREAREDDE